MSHTHPGGRLTTRRHRPAHRTAGDRHAGDVPPRWYVVAALLRCRLAQQIAAMSEPSSSTRPPG